MSLWKSVFQTDKPTKGKPAGATLGGTRASGKAPNQAASAGAGRGPKVTWSRVPLGSVAGEIAGVNRDQFALSWDQRRIAFVLCRPPGSVLIVDGVESRVYDRITEGPIFSLNSRRVAYVAESSSHEFAVVNGVEGFPYDRALWLRLSLDGSRYAYAARRGKGWFVVVDGAEGQEYEEVGRPCFSLNGQQVAHAAKKDGRRVLVVNGLEAAEVPRGIGQIAFSADGRHLAYAMGDGVVVDGVAWPALGPVIYDSIQFSPDGQRLAYVARGPMSRAMVVVDREAGPELSELECGPLFSANSRFGYIARLERRFLIVVDGEETRECGLAQDLTFSPDGNRVAYSESLQHGSAIRLDGNYLKPHESVRWPKFSPDGQRLAYRSTRGRSYLVVVDETDGRPYRRIDNLRFSPDGRRLAYAADSLSVCGSFIVVDGVESNVYSGIHAGPVFSPDSQHLAWTVYGRCLVVDGAQSGAFNDDHPASRLLRGAWPGFVGNSRAYALMAQGNDLLRLECNTI